MSTAKSKESTREVEIREVKRRDWCREGENGFFDSRVEERFQRKVEGEQEEARFLRKIRGVAGGRGLEFWNWFSD